ncbi:hypothetical protein BMT55_01960 [Listeria newyorkensis]|uniref:Uncharacterized protein n=1 Tax=Listeria newyorkensis TaxID=1497681 RepID=A0ABX4XPX1_9LIST|nr:MULTISPECIES: hypothetical protein [Listeria]KGL46385.1 hypothetical protein EP56_01990 [Listeriaceae bacterium FSL A5-0209]KGL41815.1 hypothetical protein EP58_09720 [Listeria newyorkensis]KMT58299.1 hypothetical protein X559_3056 [Listeria newyorkensis]PNP94276.1 hypothetical protein BMT55_01960 [Listeria newyorkensis]RQW67766.1 hypothetical protein DUK53_05470 [Listeria sp. SHR_NRA_18]
MDPYQSLREIEAKIAEALIDGADATIDALKAQKTEFERQLQLAALKRQLLRDANALVEDAKHILHGKETMFDDWGRALTRSKSQLGIAFESKTGDAIGLQFQDEISKLCKDREEDFQELKKSCKVNIHL